MGKNKKRRKRIKGLRRAIQEHLDMLAEHPQSRAVDHWRGEIDAFEREIERLLRKLPEGRRKRRGRKPRR